MDNKPTPNEDEQMQQAAELFDIGSLQPVTHSFDHIVGNQLMCSIHGTCSSITVSPTAVLEPNEKGDMVLVEKGR